MTTYLGTMNPLFPPRQSVLYSFLRSDFRMGSVAHPKLSNHKKEEKRLSSVPCFLRENNRKKIKKDVYKCPKPCTG